MILRSNKKVFILRYFKLLLGHPSILNFLQGFHCAIKGNSIDFEIEQKVFFLILGYFKLLLGYPSKFNFLQHFNCAIKGT